APARPRARRARPPGGRDEPRRPRAPPGRAAPPARAERGPGARGGGGRRVAMVCVAVLVAAAVGVWLAADLVLGPLRRLRAAAAGIETEGDLERSVPVGGPAELRALAGSFNAMLRRLSRSADDRNRAPRATQRFAADA